MRVSKKVRDEAIRTLEIARDLLINGDVWDAYGVASHGLGSSSESERLVDAALAAVWSATGDTYDKLDPSDWLEAAALLRDGWCPGDPVEVRR